MDDIEQGTSRGGGSIHQSVPSRCNTDQHHTWSSTHPGCCGGLYTNQCHHGAIPINTYMVVNPPNTTALHPNSLATREVSRGQDGRVLLTVSWRPKGLLSH